MNVEISMNTRVLIDVLVSVPLMVLAMNTASAAQRLSNNQMDMITAGENIRTLLMVPGCTDCTLSSSISMSLNGVTTTSTSTSSVASGTGSARSGGSTSGNSGSQRSPSLLGSVTIPPTASATLQGASVVTVTQP